MRNPLLILLILLVIFSSCQSKEEPEVTLNGIYVGQVDFGDGIRETTRMAFSSDGTLRVSIYRYWQEIEQNCLFQVQEGTYTLQGKKFSFTINSRKFAPSPVQPSASCPTEDELEGGMPETYIRTGRLDLAEDRLYFNLKYDCENWSSSPCPERLKYKYMIQ